MFGLKSKDLVVSVLSTLGRALSGLVEGLDFLSNLFDLFGVARDDLVLNSLLLSVNINFLSVIFVFRLEVIQSLEGFLKLVLKNSDSLLVLLHSSWTVNALLETGLFGGEFHLCVS